MPEAAPATNSGSGAAEVGVMDVRPATAMLAPTIKSMKIRSLLYVVFIFFGLLLLCGLWVYL